MSSQLLQILRYIWAGPNTLLGLFFAPFTLFGSGKASVVSGVLELYGPVLSWLLRKAVPLSKGALALTLGHVVLAQDQRAMERCRRHERVHVRQYERWGPFFLPAYFVASLIAFCRGRHPYYQNIFEKEAYIKTIIPGKE